MNNIKELAENNKKSSRFTLPRVAILGVGVNGISIKIALDIIGTWITHREHHYVCVTGVHGVMESQRDETLRKIHNDAGLVVPDGMPLVWVSRLKGQRHVDRVYGPDLMLALCDASQSKGYRHYFYGGNSETLALLQQSLTHRFPQIRVVGAYSPPYRPLTQDEDELVTQTINSANPDIVWVGLSTPKQEYWMSEHRAKLTAPVMIGVGAAFDFHAGMKPQAPRWMQRSGLEWLFRLITEPRRLWKRYLTNNPLFIILILAELLGLKHYPNE